MRRLASTLLAAVLSFSALVAHAQEPQTTEPKADAPKDPPKDPQGEKAAEKPAEAKSESFLSLRPRASIDPPEGSAGVYATAAGSSGVTLQPGLEIIAGYNLRITPTATGTQWFHDFDLPRAHAALTGAWGPARARLVLEAVRSASEGALLGVAGDSLVMRLREASAGYRYKEWFGVDLGVVPTLTIPELDGTFNLRAIGARPLESTGFSSPADLGATARFNFPQGYGFIAAGAYNGEGYNNRELNRGKNVEVALEVHPAAATFFRPLAVFASFVNGSSGTASARANRLTTALLWQGRRIRAGADFVFAWGVGDNGAQRSYIVDGFLRGEPIDKLILGAQGYTWARDLDKANDRVSGVTGTVGYRIAEPLEAFVALTRTFAQSAAAEALPGIDRWDVKVLGRVVF